MHCSINRAAKSIRYLLEGYSVSVESIISGAVFHTEWGSEPIVVHLEVGNYFARLVDMSHFGSGAHGTTYLV